MSRTTMLVGGGLVLLVIIGIAFVAMRAQAQSAGTAALGPPSPEARRMVDAFRQQTDPTAVKGEPNRP